MTSDCRSMQIHEGGVPALHLVGLASLLKQVLATVPVVVFFGDACRDNPLGDEAIEPSDPSRGIDNIEEHTTQFRGPRPLSYLRYQTHAKPAGTGFTKMPSEAFVAFAAAPGEQAPDGPSGGHSPYAAALIRYLGSGYSVQDIVTIVAMELSLSSPEAPKPAAQSTIDTPITLGKVTDTSGTGRINTSRGELLLNATELPESVLIAIDIVAGEEFDPP